MKEMNTWLVAQCMDRLPKLTYFSHPESSLEDFFSAEGRTILNEHSRSSDSILFGQCGVAEHELRFLSSIRLGFGLPSSTSNFNVDQAQFNFGRSYSYTPPPFAFSSSRNHNSNTIADAGRIAHQPLGFPDDHSFIIVPRRDTQLGPPGFIDSSGADNANLSPRREIPSESLEHIFVFYTGGNITDALVFPPSQAIDVAGGKMTMNHAAHGLKAEAGRSGNMFGKPMA
ncbi:hypothetical protein BU15DRAFT_72329 [Melanogaster broomeanus]|nr:hypothetical protein BU15DRAFT_72329 [Melanogaster broomeanus]